MGDDQKIFRLRYVGSRFANARLPLDVLADLPAFRDLLVSYAKDRWRRSNPERQRLPKGFDQSISFDLVRIEGGSTIPVIAWDRHLVQPSIEGFTDEVEDIVNQSFADVVTLFFNAGIQRFPRSLSSDQIKALNRFGSGLRDGEKIEFLDHGPSNDNATYLDAARRKAIITYVRNTYELRYEGIGQLTGIHVDGEIKVLTPEHGELAIKLSPDRIKDEFDGSIDSAVQFALQIELDNQDAFQRVVEAFDVELIDQEQWEAILRCRHRLAELRSLSSGWLDGTGGMISPIALANADSFLDKRPLYATGYKISPMATGGVSLEIEVNDWDYSIDFLPNGGVDFYGIDIEGSMSWSSRRIQPQPTPPSLSHLMPELKSCDRTMTNELVDEGEILFRQIHPEFMDNGEPTSQGFGPTAKDEGKLSVDRSAITDPKSSYRVIY